MKAFINPDRRGRGGVVCRDKEKMTMSQPLWWDVTIFSLAVEETLIRRVGASNASLAGELQWRATVASAAGRWQMAGASDSVAKSG